jgi:hypothetical protein
LETKGIDDRFARLPFASAQDRAEALCGVASFCGMSERMPFRAGVPFFGGLGVWSVKSEGKGIMSQFECRDQEADR